MPRRFYAKRCRVQTHLDTHPSLPIVNQTEYRDGFLARSGASSCGSTAQKGRAPVTDPFVSSALILNVGYDALLLRSRTMLLQSKGYCVESASSIEEAIRRFRAGDFDLVILCHSIPPEDRKRLIFRIRSFSTTPVISVAVAAVPYPDPIATLSVGCLPDAFLGAIHTVLLQHRASR